MPDRPLLVFGQASLRYDFGAWHPLTPRRFGPGIDLLELLGARPDLEPPPARDEELEWLHAPDYLAAVKRLSAQPDGRPEDGLGPGDNPPFAGMHEAAATVAGGSIRAVEAILRGEVEHAYHPGGGLHHAMRHRASGFCIYNDPALAIARVRAAGQRVLYVDLDVHHGDGVQALHSADPGVLTISFHETGRTLFPGTGSVAELGHGAAAGTSINVPLEPMTGPNAWLAAVRAIVPGAAAAFGADVVVSQHGADSHAWDPLAHLNVTTSAMGLAAQLVDGVAHRHSRGRWLATGGGGYAVYRVVPRAWALTWLAAAHRDAPHHLPQRWLDRWAAAAAEFGDEPLPAYFDDEPGVAPLSSGRLAAAERDAATVRLARVMAIPALLRVAEEAGWWRADGDSPVPPGGPGSPAPGEGLEPTIVAPLPPAELSRLRLAPRVIAPADSGEAMSILVAAARAGAVVAGAVAGEWLVGVAVAAALRHGPLARPEGAWESAALETMGEGTGLEPPAPLEGVDQLAALGVAPGWRGGGLALALLRALLAAPTRAERPLVALHSVAERDPIEPLPVVQRRAIAERLFAAAGLQPLAVPRPIADADPHAVLAAYLPAGTPPELGRALERAMAAV